MGVPLGQLNMQTATNTCAREPNARIEVKIIHNWVWAEKTEGVWGVIFRVGVDASVQQRVGFRIGAV